jgi:hypothetical protein
VVSLDFTAWLLWLLGYPDQALKRTNETLTLARELSHHSLALLAEAHGKAAQTEEGLSVLADALAAVDRMGERMWEAELYRLKGELSRQSRQIKTRQDKSAVTNPQSPIPNPQAEAEACFHKAIESAR